MKENMIRLRLFVSNNVQLSSNWIARYEIYSNVIKPFQECSGRWFIILINLKEFHLISDLQFWIGKNVVHESLRTNLYIDIEECEANISQVDEIILIFIHIFSSIRLY